MDRCNTNPVSYTSNANKFICPAVAYLSILAILIAILISVIIASKYSVGSYSALYPIVRNYVEVTPAKMFILCDLILTVLTALLFGYQKAVLLLVHAAILSFSLKYIEPIVRRILDVQ